MQDAYVDTLCHEMDMREKPSDGLSTVYLGGGTPSMLSPKNLRRLFSHINNVFHPDWDGMEVTMECNPDDITEDFCHVLADLPVNRVSMGAQTFSDARLRFLHRRHSAHEVSTAVRRLRSAGIANISIDLMFAFPGESLADWQSDIDAAISLKPEHLSAYSLQYEEGTPLYRLLSEGKIKEIDDELYRQMYSELCDRLVQAGYEHYEISNFALPHRRSRHNSSYWHDTPYIGLGAAAHSYSGLLRGWNGDGIIARRGWNIGSLTKYIDSISRGILPMETEDIDSRTHYDDTIMTALRTREGIDTNALPDVFRAHLLSAAEPYIADGDLHLSEGMLSLTRNGIFISDLIMSDLMWPDDN